MAETNDINKFKDHGKEYDKTGAHKFDHNMSRDTSMHYAVYQRT